LKYTIKKKEISGFAMYLSDVALGLKISLKEENHRCFNIWQDHRSQCV